MAEVIPNCKSKMYICNGHNVRFQLISINKSASTHDCWNAWIFLDYLFQIQRDYCPTTNHNCLVISPMRLTRWVRLPICLAHNPCGTHIDTVIANGLYLNTHTSSRRMWWCTLHSFSIHWRINVLKQLAINNPHWSIHLQFTR